MGNDEIQRIPTQGWLPYLFHRKFGFISPRSAHFIDLEKISDPEVTRAFHSETDAPHAQAEFKEYLAAQQTKYDAWANQAYLRADSFLLLVNSGALAGAITLATRDESKIDFTFGLCIFLFFLSIAFLGLSKWCLIVHTNFVRGEFYKNFVRYKAGRLSEFDVIKQDYEANGNTTYFGLFAALSFVTFIAGWILLVAPILSPDGIVTQIADRSRNSTVNLPPSTGETAGRQEIILNDVPP